MVVPLSLGIDADEGFCNVVPDQGAAVPWLAEGIPTRLGDAPRTQCVKIEWGEVDAFTRPRLYDQRVARALGPKGDGVVGDGMALL